jgi:hypothetical protein
MPLTIVPVATSIRGSIASNGTVRTVAAITLRNDGDAPRAALGFALNHGLDVTAIASSRGTARVQQVWDRLGVEVTPPLAPRESRRLTFTTAGAPNDVQFALPGGTGFSARYRRYLQADTSIELSDLSRSTIEPHANEVRLALAAPSLAPVPRYTRWEVAGAWSRGRAVDAGFIAEEVAPPAPLQVELTLPDGFVGVDSCGSAAPRRLASRCTRGHADYRLVGARFVTSTFGDGIRVAHLAPHASLARLHGPAFAEAVALARRAWPRLQLDPKMIFVEQPTERDHQEPAGWRTRIGTMHAVRASGAMNLVPESRFVELSTWNRGFVAAALIANALRHKRPIVASDQPFVDSFYEEVASSRTGGRKGHAVEFPGGPKPITDPLLRMQHGGRLERVLIDLEYRVGADRLAAAIEEFASRGTSRGTAKELFDLIGRHASVSLDRMYEDYVAGTALPRLTLKDVVFTRTRKEWEVRGLVVNEERGESFCPVVLRTAFGSVRTIVRTDSNAATPFVLRSAHEPQTLQLDPERVVYRFAAIGTVDAVEYRGEQ